MILPLTLAATLIALSDPISEMQPGQGPGAPVRRQALGEGAGAGGPFVSPTLPPTGHPARFKRYSSGPTSLTSTASSQSPVLSPYLNFLRSGSTLNNYYNFQRDQQIYNTAAQTQQINTQLRQAADAGPFRQPTQPFVQNMDNAPTPLQRRFQPKGGAPPGSIAEGGGLGSNAEEIKLLRDILHELKGIREGTRAQPEQKPQALPEQKPQALPEQKPQALPEQKPQALPEQKPQDQ